MDQENERHNESKFSLTYSSAHCIRNTIASFYHQGLMKAIKALKHVVYTTNFKMQFNNNKQKGKGHKKSLKISLLSQLNAVLEYLRSLLPCCEDY
ncbi:CLUMA_CG006842, isoform A [Clunio marinus]|uniref:CLUMA_CG006842, isoform A n=1 Tax=Clunio marinus TaxID=568069 RepID=A0A1J1HZB7_9DIPT|nr:CLUMA_CG006842, isoform A [Clunio marinus]